MEEAAQADRVLVMSGGKIVMDGTPKQVFSHPDAIKALGLDVPDAAELCHRLRAEGWPLAEDIIDTEECALALYQFLKGESVCP